MSNRMSTGTVGRLAFIAIAALAALAIAPATGSAGEKFGASFAGAVDPVSNPVPCPAPGDGEVCTRAPLYYDVPAHAGATPFAPRKGTLKKVKVMADDPGSFRLVFVKLRDPFWPVADVKVVKKGPKIQYAGTGNVEAFDVSVKVKRNWWLAQRGRYTGALSCLPGETNEAVTIGALGLGGPFQSTDYFAGCTHLVQGVMD